MKHLNAPNLLAAVAIGLSAIAATSTAHARSDVVFSIGVQVPGVYLQAGPVFVQPAPIYLRGPVPHWRHNDLSRFGGAHWQRHGPYGDLDRDGIINRYDRDRDGDGVRNRYDRLPNNPNRR